MMASSVISMCFTRTFRPIFACNQLAKINVSPNKRFLFGIKTSSNDEKTSSSVPPPTNESTEGSQSKTNDEESVHVNNSQNDLLLDENKKLKEENEKLLKIIKEVDEKYKLSLADGENTRIRMRRQAEEAKIYGIQNFCKDLLDVADVLNTAIESVPQDALNNNNDNKILKNLFEGIKMTEQQLLSVFRRHGLTQINPIGQKFNPNEHHALFEALDPAKEPGSVAIVTKIGYKLHERTIRPAMVGVVKAPPKDNTP